MHLWISSKFVALNLDKPFWGSEDKVADTFSEKRPRGILPAVLQALLEHTPREKLALNSLYRIQWSNQRHQIPGPHFI